MTAMFNKYGTRGYAYGFLWGGFFNGAGVACLWVVYLLWKKHGAENFQYVPKNPDGAAAPVAAGS